MSSALNTYSPRSALQPGLAAAVVFIVASLPTFIARAAEKPTPTPLRIIVQHSVVVKVNQPIKRLSVTDPKIANVKPLTPSEVLVSALTAGTTDMFIWGGKGLLEHRQIHVVVDRTALQKTLRRLFPNDQLSVTGTGTALVITGRMASAGDISLLHRYLTSLKIPYTDMTRLAGVQQVQLKVIVAEASRTAIRTFGFNMFETDGAFGADQIGSDAGGPLDPVSIGVPAGAPVGPIPNLQNAFQFLSPAVASPSTTLLAGVPSRNLEFFIQALEENQYVRILAEPTLVAESGHKASFLAGGEFPIPTVQAGGSSNAVSVTYKKFGVRLRFLPVVLGENRIRLVVAPEVSELSTGLGSVVISGFSIPAILTREAQTTLVLHSGQSFAMAGLIDKETQARASKVPLLGQIPVLGQLFSSERFQNNDTELVVLVTANLVSPASTALRPLLPGDLYRRPTDWQFFLQGRIAGKTPAYLAPPDALMLRREGLSNLRGPGAWASYDSPREPSGAALNGP